MLRSSVIRVLGEDEKPREVVHMWTAHRLAPAYAVVAGFGVFGLVTALSLSTWSGRFTLGIVAAAIGWMAANDYRILVQTNRGLVLLHSSRVRQRATKVDKRLARDAVIEPAGENLVISDWLVAGRRYHVMKRFQQSMASIAAP